MQKRAGAVKFKGNPFTLVGPELKKGDKAPDFKVANSAASTIGLADTPAKARLFSVVPSLDTPVCSIQTRRFDAAVGELGDKVACYTVSLDLPFAQARFCGDAANPIKNIKTLSDAHNHSFGENYGVVLEGLAVPILTRSIFVVDKAGTLTHVEYVAEVTSEPNYDAALAALKTAAG
ncbi:MAG: thiol peroxidase [Planctomycetes bacterium]|nr:thiol peroxidase [Planctomycetota bacterium]